MQTELHPSGHLQNRKFLFRKLEKFWHSLGLLNYVFFPCELFIEKWHYDAFIISFSKKIIFTYLRRLWTFWCVYKKVGFHLWLTNIILSIQAAELCIIMILFLGKKSSVRIFYIHSIITGSHWAKKGLSHEI